LTESNTLYTLVAKTLFGLEEVLAAEISKLGGADVQIMNRAVGFRGDKRLLYRANLELRTALRILIPIHTFKAVNEDTLYKGVQAIDWSQYLEPTDTLAIDSAVSSDYFNHSQYVALKTKDAIVDQFRDKTGTRPSVDLDFPNLRLNVHIFKDECTLSLDSSGESLHKRGYRIDTNIAPLNEVLAAGMIQLSGWDGQSNFMDPMCGSGTILIEAGMFALNMPAGIRRRSFGFMRWKDYDEALWKEVREKAVSGIRTDFPYKLFGSDLSARTVEIATANIESVGLDEDIRIKVQPFEDRTPPEGGGIVIMNPPYGERMLKKDIDAFYSMIGDGLKQMYAGWDAWMLTSNMEALKHVGLRPSRKIPLYNGSLECRFVKYSMYQGSKKGKYITEQ
jgi:putative N6-adenine-specific DNA methylase